MGAACLCLIPVVISFLGVAFGSSNTSLGIRAVEWLRDNGARGIVNKVENIYYSLNAPAKGGPGLRVLPKQAGAVAVAGAGASKNARVKVHYYRPANIIPVMSPALPGEGVWHATYGPGGSARPPVLITSFRPDPNYPRVVAGVAWIDHTRTSTVLYPGAAEPAVAMNSRGPEEIPQSKRGSLVAAFNSAFKLADSGGGFVYGGHTYAPMVNNRSAIVRYRDGRVDVINWTTGSTAPSDVLFARQNLPLILEHGQLNPNLSDGPEWGATLGNAIRVWRSAVGIDRHGNLLYTAANDQTVSSLALILQRAGAVRAMELDINTYWTSFITYRQPGAIGASNLDPDMDRTSQRYLTPDDRDFFAVYAR
ncbi:MAG: phosphodiester glycosidase family protein [Solirubrobacteraceae bacterium]